MSHLSDALTGALANPSGAKKKILTAEITPPKGIGVKKLLQHAALLQPWVTAVNITDCQRALVKMSSLAAAKVLLDAGVEPVFQLTCRDRNKIALQADLMGAGALGIPNLLCLTGDPVKVGDHPDSRPVFELEAVKLLDLVGRLQRGTDYAGNKLNKASQFFVGAVVNPTLSQNAGQLARMEKKIEAGAKFFQSQANYDLEDFKGFLTEASRFKAPVLAGILVLHSYEIAHYIHENIPGIRLPDSVLAAFAKHPQSDEVGIEFAVETMRRVESECAGFHLMSVRNEPIIPKVLERYYGKPTAHTPLHQTR